MSESEGLMMVCSYIFMTLLDCGVSGEGGGFSARSARGGR